ncbi:MAG TPA: glycosyltransferase family 4 protein [Acidimicrobiia bacterium]|nr:glycosyltransferase family 4 protein [Acidimicrobiia bacterium]
MLRVTFLVPYPADLAPGQRFRFEQWLRLLPPGSVDATIRPLFSARAYAHLYEPGGHVRKSARTITALAGRVRDVVALGKPDVVFLYREAFPFGPPVLEWLVERRVPVVYDFDDAIFLRSTSAANRAVGFLKMPSKTHRIVKGATTTTVGNTYLADFARRFHDSVQVIPTTLDTDIYKPPEHRPPIERLKIGWSGSPTTAPHLATISNALRRVLAHTPADLDVLGAPSFSLEDAPSVVARPWRRESERDDVGSFDIGLMPLPDDEWSRGKCGFKALLYMALGVPTIASPVGVNTEIIEHGVNGLLATTEEEWVEAIQTLLEDPDLRRRLSEAGRRTVVERFSGQVWAPRFLDVLADAAARRG